MRYKFTATKYDIQGREVDRRHFRWRNQFAADVLRARVKGIEITEDCEKRATGYTAQYRWECQYDNHQ